MLDIVKQQQSVNSEDENVHSEVCYIPFFGQTICKQTYHIFQECCAYDIYSSRHRR